ncbi:HET domain-containing protein [Fusarium falciforme]|uniref:HET domain-containing protein n=1 Tax=Fusarium falciforme TaxID=195108 RepID=UPI002300084A|nr:HET domain-containing protein [Fusarium falciforme]WAO94579.1 HET domain-containing protein [Fusarium falciforme]
MGRRGRYACLSYCWGKSEFTVTTRGNLKGHLELGIELKGLPQTFQDAVEVARELKLRYLWIDALCIIQDEDDHEDWKRECGNMASIYRNSYLTIAAAWATSANGGCFTTPDPGVAIGPVMARKGMDFSRAIVGTQELESLRREWFPDAAYEIEEIPVIYIIPMVTMPTFGEWRFNGLVVKRSGQGTEMTRVGLATYYQKGDFFTFFDCEKQVVKIV